MPNGSAQNPPASRVAIGLPVYNGENYLERAIESVLAQTFTDFTLIISDNASTDSTPEICRRYAAMDPRVVYHRQNKNIGAAPNFNFVFEVSRSPYFRWHGHDDLLAPDCLRLCVEALDNAPQAVLAHTLTVRIDFEGKILGSFDTVMLRPGLPPHARVRWVMWAPEFTEVYGLIRSDLLRRTSMHGSYAGSDRNFIGEVLMHGDVALVREYLFYRRDHPAQYTRAFAAARAPVGPQNQWHGTRGKMPGLLVWVQRLWCYLRAVMKAPLSASERLACIGVVVQRAVKRATYRLLGIGNPVPPAYVPGILPRNDSAPSPVGYPGRSAPSTVHTPA